MKSIFAIGGTVDESSECIRLDAKPGTTLPIDENPNASKCFICHCVVCLCGKKEGASMSGVAELKQHLAAEAKLKAEIKKKDRVIERMKAAVYVAYESDSGIFSKITRRDIDNLIEQAEADDETT